MKKDPNSAITLIKEMTTYLVLCLMGFFYDKSNHLYLDNYFASIKLIRVLIGRDIYMTGIFRKIEREFPKQ